MPLSRQSVGTFPETSSHATCQGTLGHSRLSSMSHCGLILAEKKKKKGAGGESVVEHSPKIMANEEKATAITSVVAGGDVRRGNSNGPF